MTATIAGRQDHPADLLPVGQDLVDRVLGSPYVSVTAWIDFAEILDLPGRELFGPKVPSPVRANGAEIVLIIDEDGEHVASVKVYGVRLTRAGEVDGRSRPQLYELPEDYHKPLLAALDDRFIPVSG